MLERNETNFDCQVVFSKHHAVILLKDLQIAQLYVAAHVASREKTVYQKLA